MPLNKSEKSFEELNPISKKIVLTSKLELLKMPSGSPNLFRWMALNNHLKNIEALKKNQIDASELEEVQIEENSYELPVKRFEDLEKMVCLLLSKNEIEVRTAENMLFKKIDEEKTSVDKLAVLNLVIEKITEYRDNGLNFNAKTMQWKNSSNIDTDQENNDVLDFESDGDLIGNIKANISEKVRQLLPFLFEKEEKTPYYSSLMARLEMFKADKLKKLVTYEYLIESKNLDDFANRFMTLSLNRSLYVGAINLMDSTISRLIESNPESSELQNLGQERDKYNYDKFPLFLKKIASNQDQKYSQETKEKIFDRLVNNVKCFRPFEPWLTELLNQTN